MSKGGQVSPWYRWLYTQPVTYTSVLENPDLLYDTLSTNKCYRRDFLLRHHLRFPDGLHYEDLLFSGEAYLLAERFSLVPDVVYRWNVVESLETPSISNRRSDLRNFEDRIRVHRLLDAKFEQHGATELKLHKDVKFLRHDLVLYLPDLPFRDEAFRRRFAEVARAYLAGLDPRAYLRAHPVQGLVAWFLLHDDEPALFSAVDYVAHGRKLSTRLVERDGRVRWNDRRYDAPEADSVLDVTELGFQDLPLSRLDLYAHVTALAAEADGLRLAGRVHNQLGRIPPDEVPRLALVVRPRRGSRERVVPVTEVRRDAATGDVLWSTTVDTAKTLRALGFVDRVWDLRLRLDVGGGTNRARLTVREAGWDGVPLAGRPLAGRLAADRLQTLVTPQGDLALEWVPGTAVARTVHRAGRRALRSPMLRRGRDVARRAKVVARQPAHPRLREEVLSRALRPVRRRPQRVVFDCDSGARYGGSPRAVHDEMLARGVPVEAVWVHAGDVHGFPADARLVRRGSLRYFKALAGAAAWVADVPVPREAVKPAGAVYVHTPPGTPIAWTGFDATQLKHATNDDRLALRRAVDRWDALTIRAPYDEDVLARAFRHRALPLRVGHPRNDRLVTRADGTDDGLVVADLTCCSEPAVAVTAEAVPPGAALERDDGHTDLTDLLLRASVLVTDHHPAMFDLPLRDRPVVVVGCRCGVRETRGARAQAYVDLDQVAPGPVVWDTDALAGELADIAGLRSRTAPARAAALDRFAGYDTGQAAAGVVDFLVERCPGLRAPVRSEECGEVER